MSNEWYDLVYVGFHKMFLVYKDSNMDDEVVVEVPEEYRNIVIDFAERQRQEQEHFLASLSRMIA